MFIEKLTKRAFKLYDGFIMMKNVAFRNRTRKMILFDNESSLQYNVLKQHEDMNNSLERIIKVFCLFRRGTVTNIEHLLDKPEPGEYVMEYASENEALLTQLMATKKLQSIHAEFIEKFATRMTLVVEWINQCREPKVFL